jgi:hypothetical protein
MERQKNLAQRRGAAEKTRVIERIIDCDNLPGSFGTSRKVDDARSLPRLNR